MQTIVKEQGVDLAIIGHILTRYPELQPYYEFMELLWHGFRSESLTVPARYERLFALNPELTSLMAAFDNAVTEAILEGAAYE